MEPQLTLRERKKLSDNLRMLARLINGRFEEAETLAKSTEERAREAAKAVILCGQAIAQAYELVPTMDWREWLEEHCPRVSYETAMRWRRVGKLSHVTKLDEVQTIRQLYQLAGILPAANANGTGKPEGDQDFTLAWAERRLGWVDRVQPERIRSWAPEERAKLRERLKPLHELYLSLEG
jgi:hypothetical protein